MKNVFSVLMAGVILFSVACGGGEKVDPVNPDDGTGNIETSTPPPPSTQGDSTENKVDSNNTATPVQ